MKKQAGKSTSTESELRAQIRKLQRIQSHYEEAQRLAKIGSWEWNARTGKLTLSKNLRKILGLTPDSILDTDSYLQPFLGQKIQFSESFCFERQWTCPDGQTVALLENGRAQFDRGVLTRIWGTSQDLTNSNQTQKLLDEHQARLFASSKLASLGEMAVSLAHELNNPLSVIYAKTWNLKRAINEEGLSQTALQDELEHIHTIIARIAKIIRGLRAVTQSSTTNELMEPIRLPQVLNDTLELCQARIKDEGIQLAVHCQDNVWIQCRAPQISQILLNLLNNAVDAVGKSKDRWIEIRTERCERGVRVMVIDSGPGISPEIRDRLMEPFFTTKSNGQGMGLGLNISRTLAEQHGGKLYLDTRVGHTCFALELPVLDSQTERAPRNL